MTEKKQSYTEFFNPATQEIPLLKFLYWLSIPFAKLFASWKIRPTTLTAWSFLSCLVAILCLLRGEIALYGALIIIGLIFDICDGMVARVNKASNVFGSFYDHFSDKLKIILLFLAMGLRFQDGVVWSLAVLNVGFFFLANLLSEVRQNRVALAHMARPDLFAKTSPATASPTFAKPRAKWKAIVRPVYFSLVVIYGNFMLYFIPMGIDVRWCQATQVITLLVILRANRIAYRAIGEVHEFMHKNGISWKFKLEF